MATYIPNATQTTEPVESRTVESAALEFRTLKASINGRIEDVQDGLDTEIANRIAGDANLQAQNNSQDVRLTAVENAMLFIGEGIQPGTVYVQRLSGTGAQTVFTLNTVPHSVNVVDIYINGIYQNKDTFTVSGADVIFSKAPPAGTNNIEVQVTVTIALGETDASLVTYGVTTVAAQLDSVDAQLDAISAAGGSNLVGFQQSGAGAIVRTAQDKMREWVSIKDFGAVGDGVADDTNAVQAAIRCGARVVNGNHGDTYLISTTLQLDNAYPTELRLNNSTIKAATGNVMMRLKNAKHIVTGGTFDGSSINAQFLGIIVEGTSKYSRIVGNRFINIGGCAISAQAGADYTLIAENEIINCGRAAATVSPFNVSVFVNETMGVQVVRNKISQCDWGIYMRGTANATPVRDYVVADNHLRGAYVAASQGISNAYSYNCVISGNVCRDFGDNAIDCYGGTYVTIANNKSEACKDGVFVGHAGTRQMVVTGNTSINDERGVRVWDGATEVVVSSNVVRNPADGGILVSTDTTATASRITIENNSVDCDSSGVYGIKLIKTEMCKVVGNSVRRTAQEGIYIDQSNLTSVSGNHIQDASRSTSNTYDAIRHTSTSNRSLIDYNVAFGMARYMANIEGGANSSARGNRWRSLGTGGVNNAGTGTTLLDNLSC
jgi:hypothetical protein